MLKNAYDFDEVTGHMPCLVLVTTFSGYKKAGHVLLSLKEENKFLLTHFWIILCLCIVIKNASGASNDLEKKAR